MLNGLTESEKIGESSASIAFVGKRRNGLVGIKVRFKLLIFFVTSLAKTDKIASSLLLKIYSDVTHEHQMLLFHRKVGSDNEKLSWSPRS